jgi:hypothetical protein
MSVRTVLSAHNFDAATEFAPDPSVSRCNTTPATDTSVAALIDVEPVAADTITTEHDPVEPTVEQLAGPTNAADAPPLFVSENTITVPAGALTNPAPAPAFTFTCPVNV